MDVLIVDDSRAMRMMVKRTLRKAGLELDEVREAENGREGLEVLEDFDPDVVLSDWNMPELDGHGFIKSVRERHPALPFGFVTSQVSDEIKEKAENEDADFFLTKPFTPDGFHSVLTPYE